MNNKTPPPLASGITAEMIDRSIKAGIEAIDRESTQPQLWFTRCKNCGRGLFCAAYIQPDSCPMCEVIK